MPGQVVVERLLRPWQACEHMPHTSHEQCTAPATRLRFLFAAPVDAPEHLRRLLTAQTRSSSALRPSSYPSIHPSLHESSH
eukprot:234644-Chlamydomonas_euryale.AAC.5